MARGKPKPRKGKGLLAWRSRQKPGAIMKPSTFEKIKRKARGAYKSPEAVAGATYWKTAKLKFKRKTTKSLKRMSKQAYKSYLKAKRA